MIKECLICKKEFSAPDTYRGRKKKTCSIPCARRLGYLNNLVNRPCDVCGNLTKTTKSNPHPYCETCINEKKKYSYNCIMCNSKFNTNKHGSKLCSKKCINEHNNKNMVELKCLYCKKEFKRPSFTIIQDKKDRVYCSQKCRNNQFSVENPTRYGGTWTRRKREITDRDSNMCLLCGSLKNLQVHHFKKIKLFNNPNDAHFDDNLGTFCATCHKKVEGKYLSLSEFLKDIV